MLVVFAVSALAIAQNGAPSSEALKRQATERLRALHREADQLLGQERTLLGQLRKLELDRQIANEELREADASAAEAVQALATVDQQVVDIERARAVEKPKLGARFIEMYKLGQGGYMRMLLSASDMRKLGQAARTVALMADRDRARVRAYESQLRELTRARADLVDKQHALETRRNEALRARTVAGQAIAAQLALVKRIDEQRDLNAQLVSELQAAQQKLESTVAEVASVSATPAAPAGAITLPIGPFRGALPWPTEGTPDPRGHVLPSQRPGLEIRAEEGTPVHVIHSGTVAYAGSFEGLGNLVIVDHGGQTFSLYGHLLELEVGRGSDVRDRQEIGRVGMSTSGTPSLYFELRVNGRPVDPRQWLERPR